MRRLCAALFAAGVLFAAPAAAPAEDTAPADAPVVRKISGTLSQVAFAESFILVISDEEGYVKIRVTDDTVISLANKPADLDDLDPEDSVVVRYVNDEKGERRALEIRDSTVKRSY